ncbi:hypothetical protein WUBG_06723, partial [Wuchereria bancrofti]
KVAVQQRPARSKKKKQNVLKWKEGTKPNSVSSEEGKEKRKYRPKKTKPQEKKKKLKLSKPLTAVSPTETEKEQKTTEKETKTVEKEETDTEMDIEEQTVTEAKDEESEFEATFDRIDRKKKEVTSVSSSSSTSVGSKTPSESSLIPPQFIQQSTPTIKGSQEYIVPLISSNQESAYLVAAEVAGTSNISGNGSHKGDSCPSDMMFDAESVILSTPACQVLGIIMNKQLFKNAAASETENELIRLYFAGKIPPGREKDAQETLEKALDDRRDEISKKEFVPEFWTYDQTNKKQSSSESSF